MLTRLSRNSLYLGLGRFAAQVGLALFTILLARQLGIQAFGEYAFLAALIAVGNTLTTFGTDMLLVREIAGSGDESLLSPALWLQLSLSAGFMVFVLILSVVLRGFSHAAVVAMRIYAGSMFPLAFFTVFTTALRGRQRMLEYAALNLALTVLQIGAVLVLIWSRGGLVLLCTLLLIVQSVAAVVAGSLAGVRHFSIAPASFSEVRQLAAASAPIAVLSVVGILYQRLSLLLLPSLAGASATGLFSAAARLIEAAKLGHIAVFTAIYPLMAEARLKSWPGFAKVFRLPAWLLLSLAALAAVALSALAGPLTLVLYGSAFAASASVLRLLAWILVPYSISGFLTLVFLARGETNHILGAVVGAALTLVGIMLWLVPRLGVVGAVLGAISAETVQATILLLDYARFQRSVRDVPEPGLALPTAAGLGR